MFSEKSIIRFWKKVDKDISEIYYNGTKCWEWQKGRISGYGCSKIEGHVILSHRVSWILSNGDIENDLCILHRCDNRKCVNPDHLFIGTKGDNNRDRENKGRGNHAFGDRNGSRKHNEKMLRGNENGNAKLTELQVIEMINLYRNGETNKEKLGRMFGINGSHVGNIVNRRNWKHLNI